MVKLSKKHKQRVAEAQSQEETTNRESEYIEDSDATIDYSEASNKENKAKQRVKKPTVPKRNINDVSEDSTGESEMSGSSSLFNTKKPNKKKSKTALKSLGLSRISNIPKDRKGPALKLTGPKAAKAKGRITVEDVQAALTGGNFIFALFRTGKKYVGQYGGASMRGFL